MWTARQVTLDEHRAVVPDSVTMSCRAHKTPRQLSHMRSALADSLLHIMPVLRTHRGREVVRA